MLSTNYESTVIKLNQLFRRLNEHLFNNELNSEESPVIVTLQSGKPTTLGHFSVGKVWNTWDGHAHEINMTSEHMNRPYEHIVATLIHEMVHYYNSINGIQDTSRQGRYHNTKFKRSAEEHGLVISFDKSIGWSPTELAESTKTLIDQWKDEFSDLTYRQTRLVQATTKKKKSGYKLTCPSCGMELKVTKSGLNLKCGDCDEHLEERED